MIDGYFTGTASKVTLKDMGKFDEYLNMRKRNRAQTLYMTVMFVTTWQHRRYGKFQHSTEHKKESTLYLLKKQW